MPPKNSSPATMTCQADSERNTCAMRVRDPRRDCPGWPHHKQSARRVPRPDAGSPAGAQQLAPPSPGVRLRKVPDTEVRSGCLNSTVSDTLKGVRHLLGKTAAEFAHIRQVPGSARCLAPKCAAAVSIARCLTPHRESDTYWRNRRRIRTYPPGARLRKVPGTEVICKRRPGVKRPP